MQRKMLHQRLDVQQTDSIFSEQPLPLQQLQLDHFRHVLEQQQQQLHRDLFDQRVDEVVLRDFLCADHPEAVIVTLQQEEQPRPRLR